MDYSAIKQAMGKGDELFFRCPNASIETILTSNDIDDAYRRLLRFASYVQTAFPKTCETKGIIDSPLQEVASMKSALEKNYGITIPGKLFVKRDDSLAVCGSLKARGGIYTVFKHAEALAKSAGLLSDDDDYAKLDTDRMQKFFSGYKISVGSTGNLGMSIGLSGKKLGFDVTVYMSEEAKQWKKDTLRKAGAKVVEFEGDYTSALKVARCEASKDANNFFIDDEDSKDLFLGYSAVSRTLPGQLKDKGIKVDKEHPLVVWLPCGVGGGPGGITFGLKDVFGENVYCFFGEPTQMPCMALAMAEQRSNVSIYDINLSGKTIADGLACSSPSPIAYEVIKGILDGCFTVTDDNTLELTKLLYATENIKAELSSCLSFGGLGRITFDIPNIENSTNIVWLTGGSLVPDDEWERLGII